MTEDLPGHWRRNTVVAPAGYRTTASKLVTRPTELPLAFRNCDAVLSVHFNSLVLMRR
jgi:hypothetical protein